MLERNRSQSKFDQSGDYCAVGAWGGLQMPRLGSSQRKNTLLNMNWGKSKFLGYYTKNIYEGLQMPWWGSCQKKNTS